jgi:hypothetical protein
MELRYPGWVNDSITGTIVSATHYGITDYLAPGKQVSVPEASVTRYAAREPSTGKTIGVVAGVLVGGLVALGAFFGAIAD